MKNRIFAILLLTALLLTLASCSKDYAPDDDLGGADLLPGGNADENWYPSTAPLSPEDVGKFVENEFISTSTTPVSTFSADVDTASYAYFRRLVNAGYSLSELIATAGQSIRTEEMLNYFDYGYASPEEGKLFSTQAQIAPCPWNENAHLLMLGLQATEAVSATANNLVFLIDVSGSMASADKLGLLKEAFATLTAQLDGDDVISIVTYSGKEQVVLEGCSGEKKEKILSAINSLEAKGSTNGEAGLQRAYALAEAHFIPDGNNRIIMASDGDLNVGIASPEELKAFVSEKRESGTFLSVLGFGAGNYKDANMETLADCGNGVYYYIDDATEAERVFGGKLLSTLYTVAKDVKLQLTFSPDAVTAYRLVGYENRLLNEEDFEDDTKDAGDVGAGHSLTVCYELILTDTAEDLDAWITLDVRYKAPDGTKSAEESAAIGRAALTATPDTNFQFASAVIETAMLLHQSKHLGELTLSDVYAALVPLDLSADPDQAQFRSLIERLMAN